MKKLTATKEIIELIDNSMEELLDEKKISFRKLYETIYYEEGSHTNRYADFMKNVEKKYGTWAKLSCFMFNLLDYLYEEPYTYAFNEEFLTSDICTRERNDGYYILDLLLEYGKELSDFLGESSLYNHFQNVKIKTDEREFIRSGDEEHEELVDKLINLCNNNVSEVKIDTEYSNFDNITFVNEKFSDVIVTDDLKKSEDELKNYFIKYDIVEKMCDEGLRLYNETKEPKKLEVQLNICPSEFITNDLPDDTRYFCDIVDHPKNNLKEFKLFLERCKDDNIEKVKVITYEAHILNHIRYLVYKKEIILKDNIFKYNDENGKVYKISINEKGKFEPEFPSGFYDITIDEIYNINKGK